MIEFTKAYVVGGQTFAELRDAQIAMLTGTLKTNVETANALLDNAPAVVDCLTMTEKSKPSARKAHGGTKKRKAAAPAATQEAKP